MWGNAAISSSSEIATIRGSPGDVFWNNAMTPIGTTGSRYAVLGWVRMTDSNAGRTNNTPNVDYIEMRVPVSG